MKMQRINDFRNRIGARSLGLIAVLVVLAIALGIKVWNNNKAARNERARAPLLHGPVDQPTISLRVAGTQKVLWLKVEDYISGVVAAEMDPDWPIEALKAQAVLARTFIMQKIESGERSRYGTVASTDIHEFQAYDPTRVNERVIEAVAATHGQVLTHNGRFAYAFFHSCSGGITATPYEGLNFTGPYAPYLVPVHDGPCSNPKVENWSTEVSVSEIAAIAGEKNAEEICVGAWGPSGRALTVLVGDRELTAVQLRNALGSTRMKSTLLTGFKHEANRVTISGKGWGHGVGMSQWGAHDKATSGMCCTDILAAYYPGTVLEKVW